MNIKRRYEEMARFLVFTAVFCLSSVMPHVLPAVEWTGRGQTNAWSDAGNWSEEKIPGPTDVAEFSSDSVIVLSGDCVASCVTNTSSSPITLKLTVENDVRLAASICGAISVEKDGAGTLTFAARQSYTGATRILEGGITAAPDLSFENYKAYGTLSLHLDASCPETLITDESGYLNEWKSLTDNGVIARGAAVAHADEEAYTHHSPFPYTDASGCTMVRFGYALAPQSQTNTFISAWQGDSRVQFQAKTFFLVQRQHTAKRKTYGLLGMITDTPFRFYRSGNYDCGWNPNDMEESWCNGRKSTSELDNRFENSSDGYANLLVVRRTELGKFDIIGSQYLTKKNGDRVPGNNNESIKMDLYEVLFFNETLTDAQIEDISALLMKKWNVPPQAVCLNDSLLSTKSTFAIEEEATLDCGEMVQTLTEVSGEGVFRAAGIIDLNGGKLKVGEIGVSGFGIVTNTAETKATLIVSNDTVSTMFAYCSGNIDFEKQGVGTLHVAGSQNHRGETRLNGGKVVAWLDCSRYGTLSLHLDASRTETIVTDENNQWKTKSIIEWKSLTDNGVTTRGAENAYPQEIFTHESPFLFTNPNTGLTGVRFGFGKDLHVRTNTFISAWKDGINQQFKAKTFFLVSRQHQKDSTKGILGMIDGYAFRIYRDSNFSWATSESAWTGMKIWCNGGEGAAFTESKKDYPNLLVVRSEELKTFDIIGNQYLKNGDRLVEGGNLSSMEMDLYEVVLYEDSLTDVQINEVSAYLMKKWNVPKQAEVSFDGVFAPASEFSVLADTTLDLVGFLPQINSLKTEIDLSASEIPILTLVGDWNISALPLTIENALGTSRGTILRTTGSLIGPFASVSCVTSDRLRYLENEVALKRSTFVITVR